jgi:hypothetical protein
MDSRAIDQADARTVYDADAVSEVVIEAIYERSSSLSAPVAKDFVLQLWLVLRMEISVLGHGAGGSENMHLTQISYRQKHVLFNKYSNSASGEEDATFLLIGI